MTQKITGYRIKRKPRRKVKTNALKGDGAYRALYDIVDGAVRRTFHHHPEYLASGIEPKSVQQSIAKRAAGDLRRREHEITTFLLRQGDPAPVKSGG